MTLNLFFFLNEINPILEILPHYRRRQREKKNTKMGFTYIHIFIKINKQINKEVGETLFQTQNFNLWNSELICDCETNSIYSLVSFLSPIRYLCNIVNIKSN